MPETKKKRRSAQNQVKTAPAQKKSAPPAAEQAGRALVRFFAAAGALLAVVAGCSALSGLLVPADPTFPSAQAEISLAPVQDEIPTPVPTPTPTPRAFAPFGAQYGYGGSDLIPETPQPAAEEEDIPLFTPLPLETETPEPTEEPQRTLRKGMEGEDVRRMQEALKALGYLSDAADGSFGANTQAALIAFQAVNSLTADGVAGQRTFSVLYGGAALSADHAPAADFLILVNRKNKLEKNYVPASLVNVSDVLPESLVKVKYRGTLADRTAAEALKALLTAAVSDGVSDWQISSAYRTFAEQQRLVDNSVSAYLKNHSDWSKKQALSATYNTVAPAGTSEHQTGLCFDMTVPGKSFTGTAQQKWLHAHCHEYGFVVRYTEKKQKITGFIAESWHIRYVGREAAAIMVKNDWCLEEYLEHLGGR